MKITKTITIKTERYICEEEIIKLILKYYNLSNNVEVRFDDASCGGIHGAYITSTETNTEEKDIDE